MSQVETLGDKPKRVVARLRGGDFRAFGHGYNRWQADLTEEQTLADALEPAFWQDVAAKIMGHDKARPLGLMDIIELRKRDTLDYWELQVVGVGNGYLKVRAIRESVSPEVKLPEGSSLKSRWNVGKRSHEVVSLTTQQVVAGGFQSPAEAAAWIAEHMKAMAA